jgi:hypothetical protein
MRKSTMSSEGLATHDIVATTLGRAGWELLPHQVEFERGEWAAYDLGMQWFNGRMKLRLLRGSRLDELYLAMDTPRGEGVGLYIKYADRLQDVLDTVIAFQDEINEQTYRHHIARLVRVSPEIEAGMEDGTRVRLVDTKGLDAAEP